MHRLHDYLLQLEGGMPTLLELASVFDRSAQLLNDHLVGRRVAEFLRA